MARNKIHILLLCIILFVSITLNAKKIKATIKFKSKAIINTLILNCRLAPKLNSKKVGAFILGEEVSILKSTEKIDMINNKKNYWYKVTNNNKEGWVFGGYLTDIEKKFIGIYKHHEKMLKESHYIKIELDENDYRGTYIGCEDNGEAGIFYYNSYMQKLEISDRGKISFFIKERILQKNSLSFYSKVQEFKFANIKDDQGFAKSKLIYTGQFVGKKIQINCSSADSTCWKDEMVFKKLNDL